MARYFPERDRISFFQANSCVHHRSRHLPNSMRSVPSIEPVGALEVPVQLQANKDRDIEGENQEEGP